MKTLTLSPHSAEIVEELLESGCYRDANEVIAEAVKALVAQRKLAAFRAAIAIGDEQIERGEVELYTPELAERLRQEALQMARDGRKPHPDVCP